MLKASGLVSGVKGLVLIPTEALRSDADSEHHGRGVPKGIKRFEGRSGSRYERSPSSFSGQSVSYDPPGKVTPKCRAL